MFLVSLSDYEATIKPVVAVVLLYVAALWFTIAFWTYRDIRQRSRDPFVQSAAVLLVLFFFLPGHWLYLILRPRYTLAELYERSLEEEALLQDLEDQSSCPSCKRRVHEDYLICPSCRTSLKEPCRSCQKPLSYAWVACPYCGLEKPPRENLGARPARAPRPAEAPARTTQQTGSSSQFVRRGAASPRRNSTPAPAPAQVRDPFSPRSRMADEGPVIGE